MKYLLFFSFVCVINTFGYAHETNEAFFNIIEKENTIEIQAEFPWTMRNALIAFNPSLENSTDKKDFENTFVEYLKANLILKDKNGDILKYQNYQELENNGHSHQNNYLIIFRGSDLFEITNTIMFNVYENQVNYNTITVNSNKITFKTKKGLTHFTLKKNDTKYWYFSFLFIPIIYIAYRYSNKKTTANNV
ncbi:MAG: hypothetical protein QM503_10495 [Bacteroidota bacterium]